MDLPRRQQQVLDFIERHAVEHGFPPTVREIGAALGIRSTNAVNDHLSALERKGVLTRERARSRGLALARGRAAALPGPQPRLVPLVGRIAAGRPLLAEENLEGHVAVDPRFAAGGTLFALRVAGDSMIEEGILDGDTILVRSQAEAERGAVVVALVDGEATVKRYFPERGRIRLQPANRLMKPIYVAAAEARETLIQGVVVGVMRRL